MDFLALKEEFYRFSDSLQIETKEKGLISLGETLLGSQRYFVEEVFAALIAGIHFIVCLKGRQLGISTVCLALDLFWHFKFKGMQGTLATDSEDNREYFRSTLTLYMESLPQRWRQPVKSHNRAQLILGNRSRISYLVAGSKKNVGFGAGKALIFVHATECGKWGQGTDIASLEASLAETNEQRLYIFESTAYGPNAWNDAWDTALIATTQRAIFVGWWRNELYRVPRDSEIYKTYWDGSFTTEEKQWVGSVEDLYGFAIDDEQIAWYRWKLNETMKGDENQMHEKYPPTAEYAFVMSGSQFFGVQRLTDLVKIAKTKPYDIKRFVFGGAFEDTDLVDCNERTATLKIWETPVQRGYYVIGGDPAWGSSEWADRFCLNVTRVWADQAEQVAEFCTPELNTMQFAWVMLYLAGAYGDPNMQGSVMINLELNGPGQAVWQEVLNLKQRAAVTKQGTNLSRLLQNIENFLYRRPDSLSAGYAYHTTSSFQEKERMMNIMKDYHEFGLLKINSVECLLEMRNVVREDGEIGAPGRGKDDRVIAQALACLAWSVYLRTRLIQMNITRAKQQTQAQMPAEYQAAGRSISNYLQHIGLRPKPARLP